MMRIIKITLAIALGTQLMVANAEWEDTFIQQSQTMPFLQNKNTTASELEVTLYPLDNNSLAENHYRKAIVFAQRKQFDTAETELNQVLQLNERHIEARELLVSLLLKRHAVDAAIAMLETGIRLTPSHAKFALWAAQLHSKLGVPQHAQQLLEQHVQQFNQRPDYLGALASLYQQTDRQTQAHKHFLKAAALAPEDGRWWLGVGMTAETLEDWNGALDAYRRVTDFSFINSSLRQFAQQRLMFVQNQLQQQQG